MSYIVHNKIVNNSKDNFILPMNNVKGVQIYKYHVHYVDKDFLIASYKRKIYVSRDGGITWEIKGYIDDGKFFNLAKNQYKLFKRLFRAGIHHLIPINETTYIMFYSSQILVYDLKNQKILQNNKLIGSRPLQITQDGSCIYYGEYRMNRERSPVHVWGSSDNGKTWNSVKEFNSIRHIHGIFKDPFTGYIWVTTGDEDYESAIWVTTDRFKTIEKVIYGTQQTRCVQLIFTDFYIYYGTDTPREKNYIYRFDRHSLKLEKLQEIESSVFYGCKVGNSMFLSTVCEPSKVNKTKYSVIWRSDNGKHWYPFLKFKKDLWSMKYFQNGQVKFPMGPGDNKHLWIVPFGTKYDQMTFRVKIEK